MVGRPTATILVLSDTYSDWSQELIHYCHLSPLTPILISSAGVLRQRSSESTLMLYRVNARLSCMASVALGKVLVFFMLLSLTFARKSQIATEYCHSQRHFYHEAIYWFNAASPESLLESWRGIARAMSLPKRDHNVTSMRMWLQGRQQWFAVLDDLRDLSVLKDFTQHVRTGTILVTTRDSAMVGSEQLPYGIPIEPFHWKDTICLFVLSLQSWENEEVRWIRDELPGLLESDEVSFLDYVVGRTLAEKYDITSVS